MFQIDTKILPWLGNSPLVITAYINHGSLQIFKNFEIYFRQVAWKEKLLVMTEDFDVYKYLQKERKYFVLFLDGSVEKRVSNAVDFGTRFYKQLIYKRTKTINKLLQARLRVLVVDIDAVWLRNPVEYLLKLEPTDIAAQMDENKLCGGFLFLNGSSSSVRELWSKVTVKYRSYIMKDDRNIRTTEQGILNALLEKKFAHLNVIKLPEEDFPSGHLFFRQDSKFSSPVVIHNNYIVGVEEKIERFKNYSLWMAP
eukprot:jgi/Picsp_1/2374/NSC_05837-R1_rhamnogalacturonan ii specific xylosyltransferase